MTEHKMTAKELDQKFTEILEILNEGVHEPAGRGAGFGFHVDEQKEAFKVFKQTILQVATEAVEDEIESYDRGFGKLAAEMHGESILKNIKKRLNDE